jgi:hypothetical protein
VLQEAQLQRAGADPDDSREIRHADRLVGVGLQVLGGHADMARLGRGRWRSAL